MKTYPPSYFDRDGNSITLEKWAELNEEPSYKILREHWAGPIVIKTIWLGFNAYLTDPPTGLFGTGVKNAAGEWHEVETYDTEAEALLGHERHWRALRHAN